MTAKRKHLVSAAKSRASKSGSSGEKTVEAYNDTARIAGVAFIHKIPTPTTWTKTGLKYTSRSVCDYGGWLDGGRAVVIEAKTMTSRAKFYLREVEPWQREQLDAALMSGAAAVLVVVVGPTHLVCEIPWEEARDKVSMILEELLRYLVNPTTYLTRFLVAEKIAAGGTK